MQFVDIVGQKEAKEIFIHSVQTERVSHAQLLTGPAGVGKLPFALAAAQYLNCLQPTETDSCGTCAVCTKFNKLAHPDLHFVLPIFSKTTAGQAATTDDFIEEFRKLLDKQPYLSLKAWNHCISTDNKQLVIPIHEIRNLKRKVSLMAFEAKYKVVLLWHADKLNTEAANAFLKLLEEPPDKTLIILTADTGAGLLPTITSRCQTLRLGRLNMPEIQSYLKTQLQLSETEAHDTALLADGSLTQALEILQEIQNATPEKDKGGPMAPRFMAFMRTCYSGKFVEMEKWARSLSDQSREYQKLFLNYVLQKLRDATLLRFDLPEAALITAQEQQFLSNFAKQMDLERLQAIQHHLEQSSFYLSRNANAQMVFMILALRLHYILRVRLS